MKKFKGRVVVPGIAKAEALVSRRGVNILASYMTAGTPVNLKGVCTDQNNPDLYKKILAGKALCLPETIGSTTGGMILYCVGTKRLAPACMLFSKPADPLSIAGGALIANWSDVNMPMIDCLGDEFLEAVKSGDSIEVAEDGTVTVS